MEDARKPPDAARNGGEASGVAAADPLAVNPYLRPFLPASHSSSKLLDNPGTNASRTFLKCGF